MDLLTCFSNMCRQLGVHLRTESPSIKTLISNKKNKNKNGVVARYNFGEFFMDVYYIENMKGGGVQQVIWLSFFFDREPSITFSVYDILSVTDSENFNCYTYSFVDSNELIKKCFEEIEELLQKLIPELSKIAENGVEKNKLIEKQKQKINSYFGDNIIEASKFLNDSADKILSMMFYNFFQYQIDIYILGSPALFFKGKEEKALKALKKAKYRSLYEDNLLTYLENGGKAPTLSETANSASTEKGTARQGTDAKGSLRILLYTLLLTIPISAIMIGLFFALTYLTATDSLFIFGIKENLIFLPFFSTLPAIAIALNIFLRKKAKNKDVHIPTLQPKAKTVLKYFTILAESVAIITLFTCVNSTLVLRDNDFLYSTEDFPLSRTNCQYSSIDYAAVVEGYTYKGKFQKDEHIVFVTKSGTTIDVYNSTFFSADKFKKGTEKFLNEKGVEIKTLKTID
ncbi:MAG: hypothetical protein UGF89_10830 [Acutalibacteraceae bacterium]|nr:hypothetical protein [Acutalibacteraceae bacterium]